MILGIIGSTRYSMEYSEFVKKVKLIRDIYKLKEIVVGEANKRLISHSLRYSKSYKLSHTQAIPNTASDISFTTNKNVIDYADFVLAFWDKQYNNTGVGIVYARSKKIPVWVVKLGFIKETKS